MARKIESKLFEILRKYDINVENPEDDMFKYGLDSFNALDVIVDIERYFHVNFTDNELDLTPFRTVEQMRKIIEKKLEN